MDIFGMCVRTSVKWDVNSLFLKAQACMCRLINKNTAVSLMDDKKAYVRRSLFCYTFLQLLNVFLLFN